MRIALLSLAFALAVVRPLHSAERYSVEIVSPGTANEILVSVLEPGKDEKVLWSRNVSWLGSAPFRILPQFRLVRDGEHLVLRNYQSRLHDNGWIFVSRDKETRISINDIEVKLQSYLTDFGLRGNFGLASVLDHIDHENRLFAIWFSSVNRWVVVPFDNPAVQIPDAAQLEDLNRTASKLALARVRDHQPGSLNALGRNLRNNAAKWMPGVTPVKTTSVVQDQELYASYIYLTTQKVPAAEKYIRALLQDRSSDRVFNLHSHYSQALTVMYRNPQRLLGEVLNHWWDTVTNSHGDLRLHSFYDADGFPKYKLGDVSGEVLLPFRWPDGAGPIWIYLIPHELKDVDLPADDRVWALSLDPSRQFAFTPETKTYLFKFVTVTPGEYRLKAVWDRRANDKTRLLRAQISPGDYESAESAPFTILAGKSGSFVTLHCTNRLDGGDAYYAADDVWARVAPERRSEKLRAEFDGLFRAELANFDLIYSWPQDQIIEPEKLTLHHVALVPGPPGRPKELQVALVQNTHTHGRTALVRLIDEHGCESDEFTKHKYLGASGQAQVARFTRFPRSGKVIIRTIPLTGYSVDPFSTTNIIHIENSTPRAELVPETLPNRRQFEGFSVELLSVRPTGVELKIHDQNGQDITAKSLEHLEFEDAWGSRSVSPVKFCRAEKVIKLIATIVPPGLKEERWHLPISEWPGENQFQKLNLSTNVDGVQFDLIAVTGKGEFSYFRDRITVVAEPTMERGSPVLLPRTIDDPNLITARRARHEIPDHVDEIVSRVPHAAVRIRGLEPGHRFMLMEERQPVWHTGNEIPAGIAPEVEPWFFALNRVTREQTRGLTFLVRRAVVLEFAVSAAHD
jgi:hypothetical protein